MSSMGRNCTRRSLMGLAATVLAFGISACGGGDGGTAAPQTPQEKQAYLAAQADAILERQQSATQPGLAVLVVKDGQVVYSRSKGLADAARNLPITQDTSFELASLSKPITAAAVMQLVDKGVLSLSDPAARWLPGLPTAWSGLTVHHLLSAQSGLPDFMLDLPTSQIASLDNLTNAVLLQRLITAGNLLFTPGTDTRYSNSSYVLLAEIIARASGQTYAAYLQEHLFTPLGMGSTFVVDNMPPPGTVVALNFSRYASHSWGITLRTQGPTGIHSSAADLGKFLTALQSGQVVSLYSLRTMTTIQSDRPVIRVASDRYGYGWLVPQSSAPQSVFFHSGGLDGFRNLMRVNRGAGLYYVTLSNGGDASDAVAAALKSLIAQVYE